MSQWSFAIRNPCLLACSPSPPTKLQPKFPKLETTTKMEAIVSHIHQDNKENVVPSTPCKDTNGATAIPFLPKSSASVVRRTFRRPPLQDITHLFLNAQSGPPLRPSCAAFSSNFQTHSSALSPVAVTSNYRKRKAASDDEIDSMRKNVGKILRKGFR